MSKAGGRAGAARGDLVRIFEGASAAGVTDGELLGRFVERGDPSAFEALVGRLGPMVLGTCRRMLADPHDVDDAFQATFLVLVRRARSIGRRELVGAWLHGVAVRTARRARSASARRASRERLAVVPEARDDELEVRSHWPELRATIDEEIGRLPEHHRRAVLLCDVEGLSREEAAARLGWTPNMVRGRLERARGRLRDRLRRRGLTPSGAWMATRVAPPNPSPALLAATARAALAFDHGRLGIGPASASAVALSRGVLRMMMLSKLKLVLAVALSAGFVVAGSGMIAAQVPGARPEVPPASAKPAGSTAPPGEAKPADALAELGRRRAELARKRFETQWKFYEEGRITIDRLQDASQILMDAEVDVARTPEERLTSIRSHLERTKDIERRERAELEVGRATAADLAEATTRLLDAEFRLAKEEIDSRRTKETAESSRSIADLERRLSEVERKLDRLLQLLQGAADKR